MLIKVVNLFKNGDFIKINLEIDSKVDSELDLEINLKVDF